MKKTDADRLAALESALVQHRDDMRRLVLLLCDDESPLPVRVHDGLCELANDLASPAAPGGEEEPIRCPQCKSRDVDHFSAEDGAEFLFACNSCGSGWNTPEDAATWNDDEPAPAQPESAAQQRERLGWKPLTEEQRIENLADNCPPSKPIEPAGERCGTFACPVCGLARPHDAEHHAPSAPEPGGEVARVVAHLRQRSRGRPILDRAADLLERVARERDEAVRMRDANADANRAAVKRIEAERDDLRAKLEAAEKAEKAAMRGQQRIADELAEMGTRAATAEAKLVEVERELSHARQSIEAAKHFDNGRVERIAELEAQRTRNGDDRCRLLDELSTARAALRTAAQHIRFAAGMLHDEGHVAAAKRVYEWANEAERASGGKP